MKKRQLIHKTYTTSIMLLLLISIIFSFVHFSLASDTNLAPIFQGPTTCTWGQYDDYGFIAYADTDPSHQIAFKDDTEKYNGHSSIRLEAPNAYNPYREVNNDWISVSPGDQVVFTCYIKTDSGTGDAGIIGFDLYGPTSRILEVHPATPQEDIWDMDGDVPTQGGTTIYIEYGSDWTLLTIDVTIPSTTYTYDDTGTAISPQQISGMIPWIGGVWHDRESYPDIWFADAELYINPTQTSGVFGDSTIETQDTDIMPTGYVSCIKYEAPYTGNINAILYYASTASATGNVTVFLYSDNAGAPHTLLETSNELTINTTALWRNFTITSTPVVAGTDYWFAFMSDSILYTQVATGGYHQWAWDGNGLLTYPDAPSTFTADGYADFKGSIYATYTEDPTPTPSPTATLAPTPTPTYNPESTGSPEIPETPSGDFIIQTTQDFNVTYNTNEYFKIQDITNSITNTFTITSGTLYGTGNLNATTGGGAFLITPTTNGTLTITSTNPTFYVSSNGAEATNGEVTFTPGLSYFIVFQYTTVTPPPVIIGTSSSTFYFRSDSFTTNTLTATALDPTNTAANATVTTTGAPTVTYGFRVFIVHPQGSTTELTTGSPVATMTRSTTGSGFQNNTWLCPTTKLLLGEDAIKVVVYASTDGGSTWTTRATYVTRNLLTTELLEQTWTFIMYTTLDTAVETTTFQYGSTTYNSRITGIGMTPPTDTELQTYRLLSGDYIAFILGTYTTQIGTAAYLLILLIPCSTLYLRHRNFGPVLLMFALFGGSGGLVWLFVPGFAAIIVDILLVLGASFIVWRLIR